jgi:hypothetical protein
MMSLAGLRNGKQQLGATELHARSEHQYVYERVSAFELKFNSAQRVRQGMFIKKNAISNRKFNAASIPIREVVKSSDIHQ